MDPEGNLEETKNKHMAIFSRVNNAGCIYQEAGEARKKTIRINAELFKVSAF